MNHRLWENRINGKPLDLTMGSAALVMMPYRLDVTKTFVKNKVSVLWKLAGVQGEEDSNMQAEGEKDNFRIPASQTDILI